MNRDTYAEQGFSQFPPDSTENLIQTCLGKISICLKMPSLWNADCQPQTRDETQTKDKMQTEDCKRGVKCRLGSKITRFPRKTSKVTKGCIGHERLTMIVTVIDVSNLTSSDGFGIDIVLKWERETEVFERVVHSQLNTFLLLRSKQFCWATLSSFNINVAHVYFVWPWK